MAIRLGHAGGLAVATLAKALRRAIRVSRSQPEVGEDLFNDLGLVNECDDPHGSPTLWADQRISLMNGRKVRVLIRRSSAMTGRRIQQPRPLQKLLQNLRPPLLDRRPPLLDRTYVPLYLSDASVLPGGTHPRAAAGGSREEADFFRRPEGAATQSSESLCAEQRRHERQTRRRLPNGATRRGHPADHGREPHSLRWVRIFSMNSGWSMKAMIRMAPPHCAAEQRSAS